MKIYRNFIKVYKVLSNKRHQIKPRLALFKTTLSSMYPTNCKQINKLFINNLELKADFQPVLNTLEFVYDFCFVSCKKSQNVAFRIYLHEVNSNFMSTAMFDAKLYASFF